MCVFCVFVAAPRSESSVEVTRLELLNHMLDCPLRLFVDKKQFVISKMKIKFVEETTQRCYICNLLMKDFNDPDKVNEAKKSIDESKYRLGLSSLHAEIRSFEMFVHLGYKLDLNKPRVAGAEDKAIVEKSKRVIQEKFWRELGLIVDMPKQGAGNSNTGNVARRFFENHESSASILNIKPSIIYKMGQVLEVIRSRFAIDPILFEEYCNDLYNEYITDYKLFPLTPTVHKILCHGPKIVQYFQMPIGDLSEEAQETRHKHFKSYMADSARTFSRITCHEDILNKFTLTTDPLINKYRKSKIEYREHGEDAKKMLIFDEK